MAKILNLDNLPSEPTRELVLKGKKHPIPDMTVNNFLVTSRTAKKLVEDGASYADQIEETIKMIQRCVPTVTREDLIDFSLERLGLISNFVRGEDVDEAEEVAVAAAAEGEAGNA